MATIDVTASKYVATEPLETYTYDVANAGRGMAETKESIYLTNRGNTFLDDNTADASNTILTVYGGAGNDTFKEMTDIAAQAPALLIQAGAGEDIIDLSTVESGRVNSDTLLGGTGDDLYKLNTTSAVLDQIVISAGDGNDTIYGLCLNDTTGIAKNAVIKILANAADLSYYSNSRGLVIQVGTTGQTIQIDYAAIDAAYKKFNLSSLRDASGTALSGNVVCNNGFMNSPFMDGAINIATQSFAYFDKANPSPLTKVIANHDEVNSTILYGSTATADGQSINLSGSIFSGFKNIIDDSGRNGNYLRGDSGNNSLKVTGINTNEQLWGGAGNDTLDASAAAGSTTYWFGSGDGNDVVMFKAGGHDVVYLYDAMTSDVTYAKGGSFGTDLVITVGVMGAALTIKGYFDSSTAISGNPSSPRIKLSDGAFVMPILTNNGGNNLIPYDPQVNSGLLRVNGVNNTLNAAASNKTVTINLYDTTKFSGIQNVIGSNGASGEGDYLRGDSHDNAIIGTGRANLWGGAGGNDTLTVSGTQNVIWFGRGDGQDSIATAMIVNGGVFTNAFDASDTIQLYNVNRSSVKPMISGGNLVIGFTDETEDTLNLGSLTDWAALAASPQFLTADGKLFRIIADDVVTDAAGGINYASDNIYVAQNSATATIASQADATVDLYDTTYFIGINNAAGGGGGYLRGNSADNVLTAGNSSGVGDQLWGGEGNDTLVGTDSANTFWFGSGDDHDVVVVHGSNDTINLYNWDVSELNYAIDSSGFLTIRANGNNADSLYIEAASYNSMIFQDKSGVSFTIQEVNPGARTVSAADLAAGSVIISGQASGNDTITGYDNGAKLGKISLTGTDNEVEAGSGAAVSTTINLFDTTAFSGVQNAKGDGGDYLRGTIGDNVLTAGGTDDQLWGAAGNDSLVGRNDGTLAGMVNGDYDVYWFGKADNNDTVYYSGKTDSVMLYDSGLTAASVGVSFAVGNLSLRIGDATLTIANWDATTSVNTFLIGSSAYKVQSSGAGSSTTYSLVQK